MPDVTTLSQRENIEEVEGMTSLVLRGTDTCPWKDLGSVFHLSEADLAHTLPAHL